MGKKDLYLCCQLAGWMVPVPFPGSHNGAAEEVCGLATAVGRGSTNR
jgi:hypothetical protein